VQELRGDASKAKEKLGWAPTTNFSELVEIMVKAEMRRWGGA
jgi:GDPmannose 4,6-dehydratase